MAWNWAGAYKHHCHEHDDDDNDTDSDIGRVLRILIIINENKKNMEHYVGDIVTNMNHRSGVYDSPMAQDYYVRYIGGHLQPQPIPFYDHYNISL